MRELLLLLLVLTFVQLQLSFVSLPKIYSGTNTAVNRRVVSTIATENVKTSLHRLSGKKIDDEEADLKSGTKKTKGKKSKSKSNSERTDQSSTDNETAIESNGSEPNTSKSRETTGDSELDLELRKIEMMSTPSIEESEGVFPSRVNSNPDSTFYNSQTIDRTNKVPRGDPLSQTSVPPEVVFFGEPRNPPTSDYARDTKYHGPLLFWARHATVAPRTSQDRVETVFPKGRLADEAVKYRFDNPATLTFKQIFDGFTAVMDDLKASKAFINANMDLVPSKLFLRVLTGEKLSAQSKNDLERMDMLKDVRRKYILANDQLFFPLNIEVRKAETRVMTYLAREELRSFAKGWDEVEMTLHFMTLLAARITWDSKVRDVLRQIKKKVENTVGYMAEGIKNDLMSRNFRKPSLTVEVYINASMNIERNMPELYAKVFPEVRLMSETYTFKTEEEVKTFVEKEFCVKNKLSLDLLKERLKLLDATIAGIQGNDYIGLRHRVLAMHRLLCTTEELKIVDSWYFNHVEKGYDFETYEPDEVPSIIRFEERIKDNGNAFDNFFVQVLKGPTKYSTAFSGKRPKASQAGNWLDRDPEYKTEQLTSYEQRIDAFRESYMEQTQLRKDAESKLNKMIRNRLEEQERRFIGGESDIIEFADE